MGADIRENNDKFPKTGFKESGTFPIIRVIRGLLPAPRQPGNHEPPEHETDQGVVFFDAVWV